MPSSDAKVHLVRTTVSISDPLLAEAKLAAARTGRTLSQVVEDALVQALSRRPESAKKPRRLPTYGAKGVRPGVDLANGTSLRDLMDEGPLDALR
jgi:hypothetical protein